MLPKRFPDRVEIAAVRAAAERAENGETLDDELRVAGRVMGRREMGKLTFLDLVDRSGRIQLIVEQELELSTSATSSARPAGLGARAAASRRSSRSEVELLAKIRKPLPDTFHGVTDRETRYRQRYLDLLVNDETRAEFELRARIVAAVRRYLDAHGFLEVETPVLQPRYGGAFAEPFVTHYNELDADFYLRIATELYLKRLIVGGLERVYELGKDFRNEGVSYKHAPEFTMVEWYEAYADYKDTMARVEELIETVALETVGTTEVTFRGHDVNLKAPWRRLKLLDALEEHGLWTRDEAELRRAARGPRRRHDAGPQLGGPRRPRPHELRRADAGPADDPARLPVELSPFARATDDDPTIVERFEYFVGGMELGNAFSELNDAEEQAERFAAAGERRRSRASRATRTTSRRSRTACRRRAGSVSASTG